MRARGYAREECIAVGDSREDPEVAAVVGRFFLVANAVAGDASRPSRTWSARRPPMSEGFYEAHSCTGRELVTKLQSRCTPEQSGSPADPTDRRR